MRKINNSGQALIEFILIIPVLVFIFLAIVDFGNIYAKTNNLEGLINEVVTMYKNDESFVDIDKYIKENNEKITFNINNDDNKFVDIVLKEEVNILTPGLNLILGDPYNIEVKRVIYYE